MIKTVSFLMLAAAVVAASALAAGAPKGLKATAKGSNITIVNHSKKGIKGWFITSTDRPKITGSNDSKCKASKTTYSYGKTHTDYHLDCTEKLPAGKTKALKLKMSGTGKITIYGKVGTFQYLIGTGN